MFRVRGDELGRFLPRQLDRLALSIAFARVTTPDDFEDRLERLEADARAQRHPDGFEDGRRSCSCRGIDD